MDRRRLERNIETPGFSLERALGTWRRLQESWQVIFEGARAVRNYERMALAETKLDECNASIARIEATLHAHSAA